jgi:TPP-dependent 2-oxoacid decarboxylase
MTYQEYLKILMDELENECGASASKPTSLSNKRNTKETNNLIDKLTEILRLINKATVEADDEVDQNQLRFEITHQLNAVNATVTPVIAAPIVRIRNKSLKTASLQKAG